MKKKMIGIVFCTLLMLLPAMVSAGSRDDPEITDGTGDARAYLDIEKAWFYEDQNTPDVLYTTIELVNPSPVPTKQHLVLTWMMNGEHYASMLVIGYDIDYWYEFVSIVGRGAFGDPQPQISTITGEINQDGGTVTCLIPKSTIGNPQPGDVLTQTSSVCVQRFGFWGRLGFTAMFRYTFFNLVGFGQIEDVAPDLSTDYEPVYGREYVIQY